MSVEYCICGHGEFRHHAFSTSCKVHTCDCDRFQRKGETGECTCYDNYALRICPIHGKPASDEWTADTVRGLLYEDLSEETGVSNVVDAHNAALAAERKKVAGLHEACRSEANHSRQLREQLAAEKAKTKKWHQAYSECRKQWEETYQKWQASERKLKSLQY